MKKNAVPLVVFSMLALVWVHAETPKKKARIALVKSSGASGTEDVSLAVKTAIQKAAATSRLQGLRIALVEFDDEGSADKAAGVAARIAEDPAVVAVIGHLGSIPSIAAAPVYARAGLAMLSPFATFPALTEQQLSPGWGETRNVFRLVASESALGRFSAEFMFNELRTRTAAVLDGSAARKDIVESFRERYKALGGQVVFDHQSRADEKDHVLPGEEVFGGLLRTKPDVVFFAMEEEGAVQFLAAARDRKVSAKFVGVENTEAGFLPKFIMTSAEAAEPKTVEQLWSRKLPADVFVIARGAGVSLEALKAAGLDPGSGPSGVYAYELTRMLLDALEKAGPDRKAVIAALRTTAHTGLLGESRFDEKGDRVPESIVVHRVEKGRFVPYRTR